MMIKHRSDGKDRTIRWHILLHVVEGIFLAMKGVYEIFITNSSYLRCFESEFCLLVAWFINTGNIIILCINHLL